MVDLGLPKAQCPLFSVPGDQRRYRAVGKQEIITNFTSETREINALDITFISDSTYLTGTNLTYSSARGSAAIKITGTVSGIGGYEGIHIAIATSAELDTDGYGAMGIKCVVTNSAALSDGEVYGGQFIAKHASTGTMLATASLVGLEAWAYISSSGPARTVIGANFAVHNECSGAYGSGSVTRVVQIVCDNASGAQVPVESSGICIWNMAGAWDYGIKFVTSSTGFTTAILVDSATTVLDVTSATTVISVTACAVFANAAVAMTTADNALEIIVTSTGALSAGYIQAAQFTVNHSTGALTGTNELHVIALDTTLTGGSSRGVPYWYAETIYMSTSANPVPGYVSAISVYIDDLGDAAVDLAILDLGQALASALTGGTRSCYIRMRRHSTVTLKTAIRLEGSSCTNLISIDNPATAPCSTQAGGTLTITHKIAVDMNGTTRYIAVGTIA